MVIFFLLSYFRKQQFLRSENLIDMQCMEMVPQTNSCLLLGGCQRNLIQFDIETQKELRNVKINQPDCIALKINDKFVFTADSQGQVCFRYSK